MTARSISDDDTCSECRHCDYQPGELSTCALGWPGHSNEDGYVGVCTSFRVPVAEIRVATRLGLMGRAQP